LPGIDKVAIVVDDFVDTEGRMSKNLGALEQLLMLVAARLGDRAHGRAMREELKATAGRSVSPGTVYTTMDRLAAKGLVEAWIGDETPATGGRHRRFYRLTARGREVLERELRTLTRLGREVLPGLRKVDADGA
jgi:DNA-binding PadR family transcriptional regulator